MDRHTSIFPQPSQVQLTAAQDKGVGLKNELTEQPINSNLLNIPLQRKLSAGAVDDPLEDEADAMAEKVMRMPETSFIQRKCAHCEEEEKAQRKPLASFIQKKAATGNSAASAAISNQIQSTKGSGNRMSETTKSFMESRFGADFSDVRIHSDNNAAQLSRQLNAQAFTVGNNIYFNEGKYQRESFAGKHLLAHELTHTIQQSNTAPRISKQPKTTAPPSSPLIETVVDEIHEAADGIGTDEEGIYMALQKIYKNKALISQANERYNQKHGMTMEAELRDEMSGSELKYGLELMGITDKNLLITKLPVTDQEFKLAAKRLTGAMPHSAFGWGTDEETIFAVLLPFEGKIVELKKLKLAYREITGRVLREDLRYEMGGSELSYALYLINDNENETAIELEGMVGKTMSWKTATFFLCENSIYVMANGSPATSGGKTLPCTTFSNWVSNSKGNSPPTLIDATVINCWEVILLAAYNAGEIDFKYIYDLYNDKCTTNECLSERDAEHMKKLVSGKLTVYDPANPGTVKPRRGDIVFFNKLAHVALATGNGTDVISFWPPPDIAILANATSVKDRVKIVTIEALYEFMKKDKGAPPKIEFGQPEW